MPSGAGHESDGGESRATVRVGAVAWAVASVGFLLLRVGPIWQADVGGAELVHLSGAWTAHLGGQDERFIPTLFQVLTALLFDLTTSEVPARLLAFGATATIPLALFLLRPRLSEAGALAVLVLLAFDGPAIGLGTSANASAFDVAFVCWLLVLLSRQVSGPWVWVAAGFGAATSGPVVLPVLAGAAAVALYKRTWDPGRGAAAGVGVAAGIGLTCLAPPAGWDGFTVAPLTGFGASFEQVWSTASSWEVMLIYGVPLVAAGLLAAVVRTWAVFRGAPTHSFELIVLAGAALSAGWLVAAVGEHSTAPNVALTTSLAFVLGPAISGLVASLSRGDWRSARWLLAGAAAFLLLALGRLADWAGETQSRPTAEQAAMAAFLIGAGVCLAGLLWESSTRRALAAFALSVGAVWYGASAFGVALSGQEEPIPAPRTTSQARDLRDLALADARERAGPIVIHRDLVDDLTWAFRDSGEVISASEPSGGAILIWPLERPAPAGYTLVGGPWVIARGFEPPTTSISSYVRWYADRNDAVTSTTEVAVYTRATE